MASNKESQKKLEEIKKKIDRAHCYFKDNYNSFYDNLRFIFLTSITNADKNTLTALNKPVIETNIIEAFLLKILGEYIKHEPGIELSIDTMQDKEPHKNQELLLRFLEDYFRNVMDEYNLKYGNPVCRESLAGGFSGLKVTMPYIKNTFQVEFKIEKTEDVTMVGHDPSARTNTKRDSNYWFEVYAVSEEEAKEMDIDLEKLKNCTGIGDFRWSFENQKGTFYMIADFYEKKIKKYKLLLLSDKTTKTEEEYKQMLENLPDIGQAPKILDERMEKDYEIIRTRLCESEIIKEEKTEFKAPNYIFVDCSSAEDRESSNSESKQVTRPFFYHAKDNQRFKNYCLQTMGNEIENLTQTKFFIPKESLDQKQIENITNIQNNVAILWNAYKDNDPNKPVPKPEIIPRVEIPPIIIQSFMSADQTMQMILGTFDAALGINDNQLSGSAIEAGGIRSDITSIPALQGIWDALTDACSLILELIPKYWTTPMSVPVMTRDGKKGFLRINDQEMGEYAIHTNYDPSLFKIKVKAGLSFAAQKNRDLSNLFNVAKFLPSFAQLLNSNVGLKVVLDNLEGVKGIETLRSAAEEQMKAEQNQSQQQQQIDPKLMIEQEKLKQQAEKTKTDAAIKSAELQLESQNIELKKAKLQLDAQINKQDNMIKLDKHMTDKMISKTNSIMKAADLTHKHKKDTLDLNRALFNDHHKRTQNVNASQITQKTYPEPIGSETKNSKVKKVKYKASKRYSN